MLTYYKERFKSIQSEAPLEFQSFLVQVTKYQAGKNCKVSIHFIVGFLIKLR